MTGSGYTVGGFAVVEVSPNGGNVKVNFKPPHSTCDELVIEFDPKCGECSLVYKFCRLGLFSCP